MIEPCLLFLESILPVGARFNECGVLLDSTILEVTKGRAGIQVKIANINGVWGCSYSIHGSSWGCSSPLMRMDFVHSTLKECIRHACKFICRNGDSTDETFSSLSRRFATTVESYTEEELEDIFYGKKEFRLCK